MIKFVTEPFIFVPCSRVKHPMYCENDIQDSYILSLAKWYIKDKFTNIDVILQKHVESFMDCKHDNGNLKHRRRW